MRIQMRDYRNMTPPNTAMLHWLCPVHAVWPLMMSTDRGSSAGHTQVHRVGNSGDVSDTGSLTSAV